MLLIDAALDVSARGLTSNFGCPRRLLHGDISGAGCANRTRLGGLEIHCLKPLGQSRFEDGAGSYPARRSSFGPRPLTDVLFLGFSGRTRPESTSTPHLTFTFLNRVLSLSCCNSVRPIRGAECRLPASDRLVRLPQHRRHLEPGVLRYPQADANR